MRKTLGELKSTHQRKLADLNGVLGRLKRHFEAGDCIRRGVCLLNAARYPEAADAFREAQRLGSTDRSLPALLAASLVSTDAHAASCELAPFLGRAAGEVGLRIRHALATWSAGNAEHAIASLREGIRLNPECAELHFQLGTLLAAAGDHEEAELRFTQTLNIDRDHTEAMLGLAMCYGTQGDAVSALAQLEKAQQRRPHDARIGLLLAQAASAAAQAGHAARPRAAMPAADAPADAPGVEELSRVIEQESDFVDAFLALPPGTVDDRVFMMLLETIYRVLARQPQHAELHCHCGRVLARLGRSAEAIAENERAVAIDPKCVRALIELGRLYQQTDRHRDATQRLEQAVQAGAEYADIYFLLGNLYRDQGYVQEARSAYRRALILNQRYEAASKALDALTVA